MKVRRSPGAAALAIPVAIAIIITSCSSHLTDNINDAHPQDGKFIDDLQVRAVPTDDTNGATAGLGHSTCQSIQHGAPASNVVGNITNLDGGSKFTQRQAEVIVYWAITDLCPDQTAQRVQRWRDGL